MAITGTELVGTLRALGFYDFLLPWLFAFAVVYGLLTVTKIFGDANQKVSAAIALVVAFFVTAYGGPMIAGFFASIFGGMTVVLAGILVVVLLVAMVGMDIRDEKKGLKRMSVLIVLVVIGVILFIVSTGAASGIGYWGLMSPDLLALVLVLIIIVAAVYLITRSEGAGAAPPPKKEG